MNTLPFILINAVVNFALIVLFVRFMFEFAQVDVKSPYMQAVRRMTRVVDLFSSILPNVGSERHISTAAVMLMLILYWINISANAFILNESINAVKLFFAGTLQAIIKFLAMLRYIIIGSVVASWVVMLMNVSHPLVYLIMQLSEPIIAPFRRIIPNLGMLDLSPIAAIFALLLMQNSITIIGANIWAGI
ncbi:YggT family protein [Moraxella sp. Tifton1]|uniref:YggT family protein n=1 Tax=Moraxella oculi TaxID=2940516 RepID=A0ABW8U861_9GAMM|nr:YggT family protein [Moraxella sp. Tifton1]MCL1623689.1 YggT family protein [Moraxella sp. Tifton1]